MSKSNGELLAIRNASYEVVHAELCRTCRHWQRLRALEHGLCIIVNAGDVLPPRHTNPLGKCDLWEGKKNDQ
jgi:hypothetical protein